MRLWTALRKEWLEQWRTSRLLIMVAILGIFGLTSPLLARYTPEILRMVPNGEAISLVIPPPTPLDAVAQYVKNLSQFGILLAVLLSMGAVTQEKEKGTAALMLVKPLPRWVFLAAKFAALALGLAVSLALAGAGCYYYTWVLFTALPLQDWVVLNALLLVLLLVYAALTLLASTLTRSPAAAGGVALGLLIVLNVAGALPRVGEYFPGQLVVWGMSAFAGSAQPAWPALGVSLTLIGTALLGAWWSLERQEL